MTFLTNLWNWFNGNKTQIGTALLALAGIISQLVIGVNHYDPHWLDVVMANLNYIGAAFTGVGLVHKVVKASNTAETK